MSTEKLEQALQTALIQPVLWEQIPPVFTPLTGDGLRLRTLRKGEIFAETGTPLRSVYLLLGGECRVVNYSREGRQVFGGVVSRPQIFGLFELVNQKAAYTATLEALSACRVLEVEASLAILCLQTRPQAAYYALRFLAEFTDALIERNDRLFLNTHRENLIYYLYGQCCGKPFPVLIPLKKEELAALFGMNLRTLYRKLEQLEQAGMILRQRGKVVVDKACYGRLARQMEEIC